MMSGGTHPYAALVSSLAELALDTLNTRKVGREPIGRGGYGEVWKGDLVPSTASARIASASIEAGGVVALKILHPDALKDPPRLYTRIERELTVWKRLGDHRNILPLLGVTPVETENMIWIVMPFMSNGNLAAFLSQHGEELDAKAYGDIIEGIGAGLGHIHANDIVHGDLKGANILISEDRRPLIADLGMATVLEDQHGISVELSVSLQRGTFRWTAPERLFPSDFGLTFRTARTPESDIFSFGMTIYEVVAGHNPFPEVDDLRAMLMISDQQRPDYPGPHARDRGLTVELWRYVELCWSHNAAYRPTLEDLVPALQGNHPELMTRLYAPAPGNRNTKESARPAFRNLIDNSGVPTRHAIPRDAPQSVGCFGVVSAAFAWPEGRIVAFKTLDASHWLNTKHDMLLDEISTAVGLQHPNILEVLGICPDWKRERFSVLSEWAEGGDLEAWLLRAGDELNSVKLADGIASGLHYLHVERNIAVGDLNTSNILISSAGIPKIKSYSIGICIESMKLAHPSGSSKSYDPRYQPPERLVRSLSIAAQSARSKEIDMYSFGMVLYRIYFRSIPWGTTMDWRVSLAIEQGQRPSLEEASAALQRGMTTAVRDFIVRCWKTSPEERGTIAGYPRAE